MKTIRPISIVLALLLVLGGVGGVAHAGAAGPKPSWAPEAKGGLSSALVKAAAGEPVGRYSSAKVEDGKARVQVSGPDASTLAAAVEAAGGTLDTAGSGSVRATVPTSALTALADDPAVQRVAPVRRYSSAAVTSEGVASIGAPAWQADGKNGNGVKVAVIDLGFKGYETLQGTELPVAANVKTKDLGNCGTKFSTDPMSDRHGTAVAEDVFDVAPGAEIYLICVTAVGDLVKVQPYLKAEGIKIANTSIISFFGRGDGQGPDGTDAGAIRKSRVEDGVLWVAAAGNQGQRHFNFTSPGRQAQYCAGATIGDSLQNAGNDQFYRVTVPNSSGFVATLRWDAWPVTSEDFDLFLLSTTTPQSNADVLDFSAEAQGGTDTNGNALPPSEPAEVVGISNGTGGPLTVFLAVARCRGGADPRFDFFFESGPGVVFEQVNASGSVTEPATSPYVMAVGASCHLTPGTIQPYSSQGPTIDGRVKPDITGPDANSTATFGSSANCGSGFTGTSSASPHVAGAAAILLSANTNLDPAQLQTQLEQRANDRGAQGFDSTFGNGSLNLGPVNVPTPPAGQRFTPATSPTRILDTRVGAIGGPIGGHNGKFNANETFALVIPTPVPADATAVVLNVTAAEPEGPGAGYATIFPTGAARPNSSNLNYEADELPSNQVVATIGADRKVSFFTTNTTHFVVDVNGWFSPPSTDGFFAVAPARALDTRTNGSRLAAGGTETELTLQGQTVGGLLIPADVTSVALNVTAVNPSIEGYVTAYPSGVARPNATNLTYKAGKNVPNAVTARVGTGGKVRFFSSASTDLIVDVVGYYRPGTGARYVPLPSPRRDLDTRFGNGLLPTPVGTAAVSIQVAQRDGVPKNAIAAQLNVTVTNGTEGWVTVWPAGQSQPATSSLNFIQDQIIPNSVLTGLGSGANAGQVLLRNAAGTAQLISDVSGYYVP